MTDPISLISSAIQLINIVVDISKQVSHNRKSAITLGERCQRFEIPLQTLQARQPIPQNYKSLLTDVENLLKDIKKFLKIFIKPTTGFSETALWYGKMMKDHRSHADSFNEYHDCLDRCLKDLGFGVIVNVNQNVIDCQNIREDLSHLASDFKMFREQLSSSPSASTTLDHDESLLREYQSQIYIILDDWDETAKEISRLQRQMTEIMNYMKHKSQSTSSEETEENIRSKLEEIRRLIENFRHDDIYMQQALLIDSINDSFVTMMNKSTQIFGEEFRRFEDESRKYHQESKKKSDEILSSLRRLEFTEQQRLIREEKLQRLIIRPDEISPDLSNEGILGAGAFGEVRRGRYGNADIAIKIMKSRGEPFCDLERKAIENEVLLLSYCSFPLILQIYGYCIVDARTVYLALELCSMGSLWSYLQNKCKHPTIPMNLSLAWILDIFSALKYLYDKRIIHRDIKAENVLLTDGLYCKLTDFGLSHQMESSLGKLSPNFHGTRLFMAPEVRDGSSRSTHRSDVYSAGMTAYQILKRERPPLLKTRIILYFQTLHSEPIKNLLISCLDNDPLKRVSADEGLEMILCVVNFKDPRGGNTTPSFQINAPQNTVIMTQNNQNHPGIGSEETDVHELWERCSLLFYQCTIGHLNAFCELETLSQTFVEDYVCTGFMSLVLSGEYCTSIIGEDKSRCSMIAQGIFSRIVSELARNKDLSEYEQFILGSMYWKGIGVSKDETQALGWLLRAAEQGYAAAQYQVAVFYDSGIGVPKDELIAFDWYMKAGEQGHAVAEYNVGVYYERNVVKRDEREAFRWYEKAAERGYAVAQYSVGHCYDNGIGVVKDEQMAFEWYMKAGQQGHVIAQYAVGNCFDNGDGVVKCKSKAFNWYIKAAQQGYPAAQCNVGVCYHNGVGVSKNLLKAFEWYMKAAEQGHAAAEYNVGVCYEEGVGVSKDESKAFQWYLKSATQEDTDAQVKVGYCYRNGFGVSESKPEALKWFKQAAKKDHAGAQYNVGVCYANGIQVSKDETKAFEWFTKSAEQGHVLAQYNVGVCYDKGVGVSMCKLKAYEWYMKAAKQGDAVAQYNVGNYYRNGIGVSQNELKAIEWFKKSAQRGHPDSQAVIHGCSDLTKLSDSQSPSPCRVLKTIRPHKLPLTCCELNFSGDKIFTGSYENTCRVWHSSSGDEISTLRGHKNVISTVALNNPYGEKIITGSFDNTCKLWSTETGDLYRTFEGHDMKIVCSSFDPQGQLIATGSMDNTTRIWDLESGKCLHTLIGHTANIVALDFDLHGQQIITGSSDNTVKVWEVRSGRCIRTLLGHQAEISCCQLTRSSALCITGSLDKTCKVWDVQSGTCIHTLRHNDRILDVSVNSTGSKLVTAAADGISRIYNTVSSACHAILEGHEGEILKVTFNPQGSRIVTASSDMTARLWDPDTGSCLQVLGGHTGEVFTCAFNGHGDTIITAARDSCRVWKCDNTL